MDRKNKRIGLILGFEDSFNLTKEEIRYGLLKIRDVGENISCVIRLYFDIEREGVFYTRDFLDIRFVD